MSDLLFLEYSQTSSESRWKAQSILLNASRLCEAQAKLSRLLGQGISFILPETRATLTLRHVYHAVTEWERPIWLTTLAGTVEIAKGTRLLMGLSGIDLDAVQVDASGQYPEWLVAAISGRLQATPFKDITKISVRNVQEHKDEYSVQFTLQQDSHSLHVTARTNAEVWLHLLSLCKYRTELAPLENYLEMRYASAVSIASHQLPLSSLNVLAAGDIILPNTPHFSTDGQGTVCIAGRYWHAQYQFPDSLQLIDWENRLDTEQTDDLNSESDDQNTLMQHEEMQIDDDQMIQNEKASDTNVDSNQDSMLNEIPMTLAFELGRINLPLSEIRGLSPNTVLTLHGATPDAIAIVCNGRAVGKGEAVDIEGKLGIRITHWGDTC